MSTSVDEDHEEVMQRAKGKGGRLPYRSLAEKPTFIIRSETDLDRN